MNLYIALSAAVADPGFIERFKSIPQNAQKVLEHLPTAAMGISIVLVELGLLAVMILIISKILRLFLDKFSKNTAPEQPAQATPATPAAQQSKLAASPASVELIDVDEKTAAVIMAIVSDQSGIPLNRLIFKSIKKSEEK